MTVKDVVVYRFMRLCTDREITLNELGALSGVNPAAVSGMLDINRRDISVGTVKKLCDGLNITLGEFFSTPEFERIIQDEE